MSSSSSKKLCLAKAHDYCATKTPKLTAIFIHGIAADSSSFDGALNYLENLPTLKDVRFVAYDLLGSGKSSCDDQTLNYNYEEQIAALHNSISELNVATPLVLVGHSMGTFIVTRYADTYKGTIKHLVLISAPIYTEDDLNNPAFDVAIKMFRDAVSIKNRDVLETKAFNNSIKNIVMNKENYAKLANVQTDATLIYGDMDKFISVLNYPKMLKKNPDHLVAIRTVGHHGVSREKYTQLAKVLKELIDA